MNTIKSSAAMTVYPAFLTPDMREWLDTRPRTMLTYDLVLQFVRQFNLEARQAGRLLAQWAKSI